MILIIFILYKMDSLIKPATVDFYSCLSEYLRTKSNDGEDILFVLTHVDFKGKSYAVVRYFQNFEKYLSCIQPYIMENETLISEHHPILKDVIVNDDGVWKIK